MTSKKTPNGPRLATKLFVISLVLLSIPWLGYRYLIETKNFLVEGQAQAQLLTAKGIAITLQSSSNLFNDLPLDVQDYETLSTYPLDYPIRVDGYSDDWRDILQHMQSFGSEPETQQDAQREKFGLVLGVDSKHLYAFLIIADRTPIYRHPGYRRLDNSDHLRLTFSDHNDKQKHLLLTTEGTGNLTAYYASKDWLYAAQGQPEYEISGYLRQTAGEYRIELRLPLAMLGTNKRLGLSYADVTDEETREVESITSTLPLVGNKKTNLVLLRSPTIEKVITELNKSDARIWILDHQYRVRAAAGSLYLSAQESSTESIPDDESLWSSLVTLIFQKLINSSALDFEDFDPQTTQRRDDPIIEQALNGNPNSRRRTSLDGRAEIVTSVHPIYDGKQVIGAVVLEQSTESILSLQRQSLENIVVLTALSLVAIMITIGAFSLRLTWRVRRMRRETKRAIDPNGRLLTGSLNYETAAGDEIGDLARSVSGMLSRLHQYQSFVANIPRTLRHEINNPLNTISTSLENLSNEPDHEKQQLYLERAKRGLDQIGLLVQQLAESASLEQALTHDEKETFDLALLLKSYLTNYQNNHPQQAFETTLPDTPILIEGADFRIEQLLDKLLDNALDFCTQGQPIKIALSKTAERCKIIIMNHGPLIDENRLATIFDLMSSSRATLDTGLPHLGIGLYISRLIANYHAGIIRIENKPNENSVAVTIDLPLSKESQQ